MYTSQWCGDCWAARSFLNEHKVQYQEVNIEDTPGAAELVMRVNRGRRSVPTFDIDGQYLNCSPFSLENRKKLANAIGIATGR
jgi:mycoredoxin